MANRLCQFAQMGHVKQLTKPIFLLGGENWWYEVRSVEISSAATTTTTTTMKAIESLRTKRITPEGVTGQGTGNRVEVAVLPTPPPRRIAHRGAGRWVSLAGMGRNSVRGERGRFVRAEAAVEDSPLWLGAHAQGLG